MSQTWETLRKEARRLETEIDGKLVEYAKLASSLQSSSSTVSSTRTSFEAHRTGNDAVMRRGTASRDTLAVETMTTDMEALLSKLSAVIEAMSATSAGGGSGTGGAGGGAKAGGAGAAHTLQRHTEILHDYRQEFRKTRGSIASLREHAELLAGADRSGGGTGVSGGGGGSGVSSDGASLDVLYKERASVAAATAGADTAIATGLSLKEDLDRQRAMFASMVERVETMSENLPAVNRLIGQIRRKKKRDVLILAAVVSTLLFITFTWKVMG